MGRSRCKDGRTSHSKEGFRRKFERKKASRKTTQQVEIKYTEGSTHLAPYMKLVVRSTKQTELEEGNWEGQDPNTV